MATYQTLVIILSNVMIALFVTIPALLHIYKMLFWINASGSVKKIEIIGSGETEIRTPVVAYVFDGIKYEISYRGLIGSDNFEIDKNINIKIMKKNPKKFVISNWSVGIVALACTLSIHAATLRLLAIY